MTAEGGISDDGDGEKDDGAHEIGKLQTGHS